MAYFDILFLLLRPFLVFCAAAAVWDRIFRGGKEK